MEEARCYFLAVDVSAPFDSASYKFPFCRIVDGIAVAAKTGWRASLADLEKQAALDQGAAPFRSILTDARSLVDRLELRLGDVKDATAWLRRQWAAAHLEF